MKPIRIYWEKDFDENVKGRVFNTPVNSTLYGGDVSIPYNFGSDEIITGIKIEESEGKIWVRIHSRYKERIVDYKEIISDSQGYEQSCQYCGVIIGDGEKVIMTGHGVYHIECYCGEEE